MAPSDHLTPFGLSDVGLRSSPAFGDIDGDGDLDAFVGGTLDGTTFFENTGGANTPTFAPPSSNPFGLTDLRSSTSPGLADIDADGDLDAFLGTVLPGSTIFFENTGTPNAPSFAAPGTNPFGLADVEAFASPSFADIDGDGDLDALVGEGLGKVIFFESTGTAGAPAFGPPSANPFGLTDPGTLGSPAFADIDGDGDLDAFVGVQAGTTFFFENTGTATDPGFAAPVRGAFGLVDVGADSSPILVDIDGDGDLDAFIGEWEGNTNFVENTGSASAPAFVAPAALCPPAPSPACTTGFEKGSLLVNESKPGKENLIARLQKGSALSQADFGDPLVTGGTYVALCVYDDAGTRIATAGAPAGEFGWNPIGRPPPDGKGFTYKNKLGSSDGIATFSLKGGSEGKSSLACRVGNDAAKSSTSLPTGIAEALADAASVTLQVHTSDEGFSATLTDITKQEPDLFKAR